MFRGSFMFPPCILGDFSFARISLCFRRCAEEMTSSSLLRLSQLSPRVTRKIYDVPPLPASAARLPACLPGRGEEARKETRLPSPSLLHRIRLSWLPIWTLCSIGLWRLGRGVASSLRVLVVRSKARHYANFGRCTKGTEMCRYSKKNTS